MKTILVDAISGLIRKDGTLFQEMYQLLEEYPNPKLVLTGANDEQWKEFNLDISPYEVFTLKHDPEKTDPKYFRILLDKYKLKPEDVVFFEHSEEAAKTAQSFGIETYFYDYTKEDMDALKQFLDRSLSNE
jgi:HAD superfamily hydrolase (TIGR01509 family)